MIVFGETFHIDKNNIAFDGFKNKAKKIIDEFNVKVTLEFDENKIKNHENRATIIIRRPDTITHHALDKVVYIPFGEDIRVLSVQILSTIFNFLEEAICLIVINCVGSISGVKEDDEFELVNRLDSEMEDELMEKYSPYFKKFYIKKINELYKIMEKRDPWLNY